MKLQEYWITKFKYKVASVIKWLTRAIQMKPFRFLFEDVIENVFRDFFFICTGLLIKAIINYTYVEMSKQVKGEKLLPL